MKRWHVIHKIKAAYADGQGESLREIADTEEISRNTVAKYARMPEAEIQDRMENRERAKELDAYRDKIRQILLAHPRMRAPKVRRTLAKAGDDVEVSQRTFRRYLASVRRELPRQKKRSYEPVIDLLPAQQCQVDLGEKRDVLIGGIATIVYFAVFVLSFSRLMYLAFRLKPVSTEDFIQLHDEAFRFFGGRVEECVYDQTKLVAIREEFREVWFNPQFYQYAAAAGFAARVCEGYDPESKGRVESGVKYVKGDFLYAEEFASGSDLARQAAEWLADVANTRIHGATHRRPLEMFDGEEKARLLPYLRPSCVSEFGPDEKEKRLVDSRQLVSYNAVYYSVPTAYVNTRVRIREEEGRVRIFDIGTGVLIADHPVSRDRGRIVKNASHYRDRSQTVANREGEVVKLLGEHPGRLICQVLQAAQPSIYKDQLVGVLKVVRPYVGREDLGQALEAAAARSHLSAVKLREFLGAFYGPKQGQELPPRPSPSAVRVHEALAAYKPLADVAQGGRV